MRTLIITLAITSILASCSTKEVKPEKSTIVFENNAEIDEWAPIQSIKQVPNAHSGKFVSVIDSVAPYGLGISKSFKEIGNQQTDSVLFNFWIFVKNINTDAKTICDIVDPTGKDIQWMGVPIKDKVKEANKWIEIKEVFKMPANINKENYIKLFVMNTSKDEILIDDIRITFY